MRDNELIKALISTIKSADAAFGLSDIPVKQSYQATQQGVDSSATIYLFKIAGNRYGWMGSKSKWDSDASVMNRTETQYHETTFQFSALVRQDPSDTTALTASDVLDSVATVLNSPYGIASLKDAGIGVLRIQDIKQTYFKDDMGRFEASPSFDVTLTHKSTMTTETDAVQSVEFNIDRI
jgi:hypothetical protein